MKYKLLAWLYNRHIENHSWKSDYAACKDILCRFGWWLERATGEVFEKNGTWYIKDTK